MSALNAGHCSGSAPAAFISDVLVEAEAATTSSRDNWRDGPTIPASASAVSGSRDAATCADDGEITRLGYRADFLGRNVSQNKPAKTTAAALEEFRGKMDQAVTQYEQVAQEKQHARGKLSARERVDQLLDEDSFVELDALNRHRSRNFGLDANRPYGDGVIIGYGTIDGRQV